MGFNIVDLKYSLLVNAIGELTKLGCDDQEKADIDRSTELSQELGRIITEVRDSNDSPEIKKVRFATKLADALRRFGAEESEIDGIVQQTMKLL